MRSWRRWMDRLSFTFLILSGLCGYELWQITAGRRGTVPLWRSAALTFLTVLFILLFLLGTHYRHRGDE